MTESIEQIIARWDSDEGKPYKGLLIDWEAYRADPSNIGCMCAQGQVLNLIGGWTPRQLLVVKQAVADKATAQLLNISIAHAVLLRVINDNKDGAPSIVLTNPEKVLGDQAHIVLAFWRHIDRMTADQWVAACDASWDVTWFPTKITAKDFAWSASWLTAKDFARTAAWSAGGDAWLAAWNAGGPSGERDDFKGVQYACAEIQGARIMRERRQPFTFLPMFGFADPEAILVGETR